MKKYLHIWGMCVLVISGLDFGCQIRNTYINMYVYVWRFFDELCMFGGWRVDLEQEYSEFDLYAHILCSCIYIWE